MDPIVLFAAAVVLVFLVGAAIRRSRAGGSRRSYPPFGTTIFHQVYNLRRIHDHHADVSCKHATFRILAPSLRMVCATSDPAVVEHILKTNFANYGKGRLGYELTEELFGDGIFGVDGDEWRHQRKVASVDFSAKMLSNYSRTVFQRNAAKLACVVSACAASDQTMEFQGLVMRATMDSIFSIAAGTELNCLDGSEEGSRFVAAFDDSSEFTMLRFINPYWRILRYLNVGTEAMLKERIKVVDSFVYKLINDRFDEASAETVPKDDILSRFVEKSRSNPRGVNLKYLRDVILNFTIAGKDTTAGAMSWFLYMVCKNRTVQEKIHREITSVTKTDALATIEEFSQSLDEEALSSMHYLHAALTETLRLYPSVPADMKICVSDDVLPNGYNIKKDDVIYYQPYVMGRMEYLWGEDAVVFRPERWLDDDGVFQPQSPFKFTAFQAGPRICLGKEFAYTQMKIFTAVLLRFFAFRLEDEKAPVNYRNTLTLHIAQGLYLKAIARVQ